VPAEDGFDALQEEGQLDGRTLARLVAAPADHRVFRRVRTAAAVDVALTLLVDCSGSMKAHAETVAVLADTLARASEQAGLAVEVLGHSTAAWNGGRALRDWRRAGQPPRPGRLNERLHLVFKPFERPWRRSRRALAAFLQPEPFREGLDGEALAWAAARLEAVDARRRVLLVVSDGSPTDGATALANGPAWLDRHLAAVADGIERAGRVELHALGVGLDLSPWYRSSHLLDLDARIGNAMFGETLALLARRRPA
jgi:cobaltochelatase CobT